MIGLFVGTLCTAALFATLRHRRHARFFPACGPHLRHAERGGFGHGFGQRSFSSFRRPGRGARGRVMYELLRRLDATPAQEKALLSLAEALVQQALDARRDLREARHQLGRSFASDVLDPVALEASFARGGELFARMSRELKHALAEAHEVLDPEQREQLAAWLGEGTFSSDSYGW